MVILNYFGKVKDFSLNRNSILAAFLSIGACASYSFASSFGYDGTSGQKGFSGRDGRNSVPLVIKADGNPRSYDLSGGDGSDGGYGENGRSASSCSPPFRPSNSLEGADGGAGGQGGNGGSGGSGGAVTVYFSDIGDLSTILIKGRPGRGGRANWGGRGGDGCRCSEYSWTIGEAPNTQTYSCRDGQRGQDAGGGTNGSDGSYGRVLLISQLEPVPSESPSMTFEMAKMLDGPRTLSKNIWEYRRGANALFGFGTDIADSYTLYKGHIDAKVGFRWEASRPLADLKKAQMSLELSDEGPQIYLPSNVWADYTWEQEGDQKTAAFKSFVFTSEIGNLKFGSATGDLENHQVHIIDGASMSLQLSSTVQIRYLTAENGSYRQRFSGVVPSDALQISAGEIIVEMGELGIDPGFLKLGTKALIEVTITRGLGNRQARYQFNTTYAIRPQLAQGDMIEVLQDANLLSGNTIVGKVKKGEKYLFDKIQGDWVGLKTLEGVAGKGVVRNRIYSQSTLILSPNFLLVFFLGASVARGVICKGLLDLKKGPSIDFQGR